MLLVGALTPSPHELMVACLLHSSFHLIPMEANNISQGKNLDQLVFNAPLISTRRSWSSLGAINGVTRSNSTSSKQVIPSSDAISQRVPFSWEISPGVPKDSRSIYVDSRHFPPKPPPSRWRRPPPREGDHANGNGHVCRLYDDDDDGNEGDDDRESSKGSNDDNIFSDALEEISPSEELDIACGHLSSFEGLAAKDVEQRGVRRAPSFIMKRFLPAANALANASAAHRINPKHNLEERGPPCSSYRLQRKQSRKPSSRRGSSIPAKLQDPVPNHLQDQHRRDQMPSNACGLMLFLPWTLKPIVCGFNSPARSQTPRSNYLNALPRRSINEACDHGWSFKEDDNCGGDRFIDKLSTKACHSPGWGLGFLDTSRLRIRGRDQVERCEAKARMKGIGSEKSHKRRDNRVEELCSHGGRAIWNLPQLTSPSESWLSHALRSNHRRH